MKRSGIDHTAIFVLPPSFEVLERRLRGRSDDTEAAMQRRLAAARAEVGCYVDYDYVVVNDQLEPTVVRLQEIIAAERSRMHRMKPVAEDIIKTFQTEHRDRDYDMALIALGVTGGIGAYKAVEIARGLQKHGHDVVAVMTRSRREVRRAADLRGDHAPRGDHRSVEARRQRRHRAHRDRLDHRPAAGGAGHRQHHRQVRQRHRRRLPVVALPRDDARRC